MDDPAITPDPLPRHRPKNWTICALAVEAVAPYFVNLDLKLANGPIVAVQVHYDGQGKRRKMQARFENNALVLLTFIRGKGGFIDVEINERLDFHVQMASPSAELAA